MAPAGQGQVWSDVLCCVVCSQVFSTQRLPVNLACGHVVCRPCILSLNRNVCPFDETEGKVLVSQYPPNSALLHIVTGGQNNSIRYKQHGLDAPTERFLDAINNSLNQLASHLCRAESERGGTVYSEVLSRTMQRKLVSLICYQLVEEEGRSRALKTCRAVADRVMTEIILSQQVPSHLSTQLWTAVRSRGCQFLGPAMQEDVLKLILLTLRTGAPIARKTLVMYVVQMLTDDYPQVSKTCVGHVVQLLYRASCFHVLKREGESSLMQLKEEFRSYEDLRREHDTQIVQMALEAGLRICPDQWSSLLYGDLTHRSHMQSIIDKLSSMQSYEQGLEEVAQISSKGEESVTAMMPLLNSFRGIHPTHHEKVNLERFTEYLDNLSSLLDLLVQHNTKRMEKRARDHGKDTYWKKNSTASSTHAYKTKMCRDVLSGASCPRGGRCTWAHSENEMQEARQRCSPPAQQRQSFIPMNHMTTRPQPINAMPVGVPIMTPPQPYTPVRRMSIIQSDGRMSDVPMVPVAVHQPMPMLLMPSTQPTSPPVLMTPATRQVSQLGSMWQPQPTMLIQQAPQPSPNHQTFWISQNPPMPMYPLENNNMWGGREIKTEQDPDQLLLKRKEILSRLEPFQIVDNDDCENDCGIGHVSYTVASSVLDERGEFQYSYRNNPPLELPPIAGNYAPVLPPVPPEETIMIMGDIAAIQARPRAPSLPVIQVQVTTVLTACPGGLIAGEAAKPATVQSDISEMQMTDSVSQPLPTAVLQGTQVTPVVVPIMTVGMQPVVVPVVGSVDPQDVVSNTLDRILDVKERLQDAASSSISCAVSEQLREELRIAEREMDSLDPRTQASCLLKELEQVDRDLERMELSRPPAVDC